MKINRFSTNPILYANNPQSIGANLNGPSLIRVPDWLPNPLGKYYLYFSHHKGTFIRLAYADQIEGPWKVYEPGTLRLEQTICSNHIASPDVHIDPVEKRIRMYFHGPVEKMPTSLKNLPNTAKQVSFVSFSNDGISFTANTEILGAPYFRVIRYQDWYYALGMPGHFYRSRDGITQFEAGPVLFTRDMRHSALQVTGDQLWVYYSQVGDKPEHILRSKIDLKLNWMDWQTSSAEDVILPEYDYEGVDLPLQPSIRGWAPQRVRQLRDPGIFVEDGKVYLLYSIAGEFGLSACRIEET